MVFFLTFKELRNRFRQPL
jgi:hypothetical protein